MADLLIRGAKIVDGTGAPWYKGELAVAGDTIVKMGRITDKEAYKRVIDADGLILSPGFIDMHSHSDLMQLADPLGSAKIRQGITTELLGQDGLGVAPMEEGVAANYRQYLTGLLGNPAIDWSWRSFAEYLEALEGPGTATNLAVLVSHGPLRLLAVGMDERPANAEELNKINQLATQAMEQGAFGLSTGLIYPPVFLEMVRSY
ncbi:hypothetical protein N752_25520 [Desulforamulus aquiferis]|nr:amidohydrolase family protein [Desulforamulus aquiferis]RYD02315.1 hypothetical protein N752_25520 [Desulforamulus aquiferis]